ncbi:MAG: hypothetical protein FWH05_02895 [Oscillospiraceae bacterium]|nr:hypothetical protein [Oscillospiraceae bacterium]
MKKQISIILAIAMSLSVFAVSISAETKIAEGYAIFHEAPGGDEPYANLEDGCDPVEIWAGGGRATMSNGAVVARNLVQLNLFHDLTSSGEFYNVTAARSTLWNVAATSSGVRLGEGNKIVRPAKAVTDIAKVARGRVQAGREEGKVWVNAYHTNAVALNKDTKAEDINESIVEFDVKQAANIVKLVSPSTSSGAALLNATRSLSQVSVPVGVEARLNVFGMVRGDSTSAKPAHKDNTYSVTAVVNPKVAGATIDLVTAYVNANDVLVINSSSGAYTSGVLRARVTVQNDQSGRRVNLTVNVGNSVTEVNSSGEYGSSGYFAFNVPAADINSSANPQTVNKNITAVSKTLNGTTPVYLSLPVPASATTDKPAVAIIKGGEIDTDNPPTGLLLFNNGNPRITVPESLRAPTTLRIQYNAGTMALAVTPNRNTPLGTYTAIVVFNSNAILQIPIIIQAADAQVGP